MRLTPRVFAMLCASTVVAAAAFMPGDTTSRTFSTVDATATKHPDCVDAARWQGRETVIAGAREGKPMADACIDGHGLHVLVDPSISGIILPWNEAVEMDLKPNHKSYDRPLWYYGRTIKAARHRFSRITVGSIEVRDIEGYITNDPDIRTAIVGKAFLKHLERHGYDKDRYVLVAR